MSAQVFDSYGLAVILILAVAMPLVGIWDFRRLVRRIEEGREDARTSTYRWILAIEWTLTLALLGWWFAEGRGPDRLGLLPAVAGWQWLAVGLGLAVTVFMIGQMVYLLRRPAQLRKMRDDAGHLAALGPQTQEERRLFAAVSVTAGVCEEILYRGILLAVLAASLGTWPAVALSSLIFGLGHAYQGAGGFAKTALVGLVLALITVFSGTLYPAIVLHAVIDLTSGRLLAEAQRGGPPAADAEDSACCAAPAGPEVMRG